MNEEQKKKHDELRERMREHDEVLLELLRRGPIDLISKVITDYLSQLE